jgi:choline-sulfatase
MARRPNVLILMADQLAAGALPAYGNRVARTPHMDALAERGVVFGGAYCNSPLCAPSRAVFMSGRLPSATGAYDNAAEFPSQVPTFAHYLRHAGYRTSLTGKMHFCGPDQLHGFEERLTTDIYPADYGWTPDWRHPDARPDWYHNMDSVTLAGPCVRTNQLDFDEEVAFSARQRLFDIARGADDRPFLMVVSLSHPHDPFTIPDPWWSRIGDAEVDMPRVRREDVAADPHSLRLRHVCAMDEQAVTEAQVRAARRAYYGACSFVDDQVGMLLEALRSAGMEQETIVILLADHGEMLGERGLWYKMSFFEAACRVPLVVHAPGFFSAGRREAPVSLADILPTLAEIAGDGQRPEYATPLDGRSLLPQLSGGAGQDEVLGEYLAEGALAPILMLRRGTAKFVHSPADPDQLYDLETDPEERVNLASDPLHAPAVAALRAEVGCRWDLDRLNQDVLASQQRRRFVAEALRQGAPTSWDHQPIRDASRLYIRNGAKLDDLEATARFPRAGAATV